MNRKDYDEKIEAMLSDKKTYLKITDKRKNPTTTTEKEMNKVLMQLSLTRSLMIRRGSRLILLHTATYTLQMQTPPHQSTDYPKSTKLSVPLRPITSSIGSQLTTQNI